MSLTKAWYTVEQATAKYGVAESRINKWVELGLVRSENDQGEQLVNGDDIEQQLHFIPSV